MDILEQHLQISVLLAVCFLNNSRALVFDESLQKISSPTKISE